MTRHVKHRPNPVTPAKIAAKVAVELGKKAYSYAKAASGAN